MENPALVYMPALQDFIARKDCIQDVLVRVTASHLDIDRPAIPMKFFRGLVEPVMRSGCGLFIRHPEEHDRLPQGIRATDGPQLMNPGSQSRHSHQPDLLICAGCLSGPLVKMIVDCSRYICTCRISIFEGNRLKTIRFCLFRKITTESRCLCPQRQGQFA